MRLRHRRRVELVRDELAARRSVPPAGDGSRRARRDASRATGAERRLAVWLIVIRLGLLAVCVAGFGVAALLLVGPGSDAAGVACLAAGFAAGWLADMDGPR